MHIKQLTVQGVRNLSSQTLEVSPRINLLAGPNGSGKTSLLEAIHILGRGRSFRSRSIKAVISVADGVDQCVVYGLLEGGSDARGNSAALALGVSRETKGGFRFKVGGELVNTASALAEVLPLVLINTESFQLLTGGPQNRRRYLDWGLFHTRSSFRDLWRKQQRVLQQRNALLKKGRGAHLDELEEWDEQFAELSEDITALRREYLQIVEPLILDIFKRLLPVSDINFSYYQGWDGSKALKEVLKAGRDRDIMMGSSQHGPHRADVRIRFWQQNAAEVLSRGQAKALVMAMMIAQGTHYRTVNEKPSVFLIDDLPAELDRDQQQKVAELLTETDCQAFITGTDVEQLLAPWQALGWVDDEASETPASQHGREADENRMLKVFHVKHGEIS